MSVSKCVFTWKFLQYFYFSSSPSKKKHFVTVSQQMCCALSRSLEQINFLLDLHAVRYCYLCHKKKVSFKGNSKVNQILNLLFDYRCKLYSMSCYLTLPFCSVLFYSLFQEMSVLFQFIFRGPAGYGHGRSGSNSWQILREREKKLKKLLFQCRREGGWVLLCRADLTRQRLSKS